MSASDRLPVPHVAIDDSEPETVDAVAVLVDDRREVVAVGPVAKQAAVVAAGSFVAGATAIALMRGASARRRSGVRVVGRGKQKIVSSQSLLVDIHVLGRR